VGSSNQAAPLSACVDRALAALHEATGSTAIAALSGHELLMERAWLTGARFREGQSTSGRTRLVPTRDGAIAIGLVRDEDWSLLPAWLETDDTARWQESESCWRRLGTALRQRDSRTLIDRGRLLGLAVAPTDPFREPVTASFAHLFDRAAPIERRRFAPLVIDLSGLWAGPLSTHLLQMCGANVVKVESSRRPDGARSGNADFYALLNQGKRSVALDLTSREAHGVLEKLIERADILVESSRPRALQQMGIRAEAILNRRPELIWVSITGYGRAEPMAHWVAFGDDAGAAAGLSDAMKNATGALQFAGDAIADPLTGVHAALAAWQAWRDEAGGLIELPLVDVAGWCLNQEIARLGPGGVIRQLSDWWREVRRSAPPTAYSGRPVTRRVAALGADTEVVLRELSC
jgi:crotonobetainyl-CoA:carnitine CoA-transferase CaiB-like acyl-CoA transferase